MGNSIQDTITNIKEAKRLLTYAINQGRGNHETFPVVKAHDLLVETIETLTKYQASPAAILVDILGQDSGT